MNSLKWNTETTVHWLVGVLLNSDILSRFRANQSLFFLLNTVLLSDIRKYQFYSLWFDLAEARTYEHKSSKLTITLVRWFINYLLSCLSGKQPTIAKSIRNFVITHPDYKHESVVSEVINYDLLKHLVEKTKSSE